MNERIERVKDQGRKFKAHFQRNKTTYLASAGTAVVAVVGTVLVVNRTPRASLIHSTSLMNYKPKTRNSVVFKVEALGDPGNVVRDTTTGVCYPSQNAAARALDVAPARISENLQGKLDHVKGHAFEVLGKAGDVSVVGSR